MTEIDPAALVLSLGVAGALLAAVVIVVWWIDRYDREPWPVVLSVFLWGLVVAPVLVSLVGFIADGGTSVLAVNAGRPLVEETAKGLGILLVLVFSRHFDNPTDGLVYGTAVGLGFAMTENLLYGFSVAPALAPGDALSLILGRTVFTAGVHALASSAVGAGLGFGRTSGGWVRTIGWALLGVGVAVALHGGWNLAVVNMPAGGAAWVFPTMILGPLYLTFILSFAMMLWAEHRILLKQLSEEVVLGTVPPWVGEIIPFYRRRVKGDWWPSREERIVISRLLTRLAFRKHALAARGHSATIEGLEVVRLRATIQGILGKPETAMIQDCESVKN
ncbi:MAG: hypothetical protein DRJ65_07160 [Acidobacteria bacterium]|nr:MAG: hypothetical protein DRJ65_07160 [Acidobacteriota bacterium]